MPTSSLSFDGLTLTTLVNRLLAAKPGPVGSITCVRAAERTRLTLSKVNTGMKVFGSSLPLIDADLLLSGTWADDRLHLTWEVEAVRGIPAMAAKLVGKPTLAKLLIDALGKRWGLDQAVSADAAGDLILVPGLLKVPLADGVQIVRVELPGSGDEYVVSFTFSAN